MRDFRFRAWDKYRKEIFQVAAIHIDDEYVDLFKKTNYDELTWANITDVELMQYTGEKDDSGEGVDIYDGDILEISHSDWTSCEIERVEVKWCGNGYPAFDIPESTCARECNGLSLVSQDSDYTIIVIGNIYENPELINEVE